MQRSHRIPSTALAVIVTLSLVADRPALAAPTATATVTAHVAPDLHDAPSPIPQKSIVKGTVAFPMDASQGQPIVEVMLDGLNPVGKAGWAPPPSVASALAPTDEPGESETGA